MIYDKTQTIEAFVNAAAAKQPAPGGGSTAALAGALAAAMGEMAVNYSIGRMDLADHRDELAHALAEFKRARQLLLELMCEDQAAYEAFTAARKLPESDPQRQGKFDAALLACIRIPQAVGATAAAVLQLCERLADHVNKYLISDLAVGAELAMATIRCASYNVRINSMDVSDPAERARFESAAGRQVAQSAAVIQRAMSRIWAWQGQA